MSTIHALVTRGQNRGTNGSPGTPEYYYKKGGRITKKAREFENGRIIDKILSRRENSEKLVKLLPGILEKAIIAHTQIQKESNFTSLKGENNHLRL